MRRGARPLAERAGGVRRRPAARAGHLLPRGGEGGARGPQFGACGCVRALRARAGGTSAARRSDAIIKPPAWAAGPSLWAVCEQKAPQRQSMSSLLSHSSCHRANNCPAGPHRPLSLVQLGSIWWAPIERPPAQGSGLRAGNERELEWKKARER